MSNSDTPETIAYRLTQVENAVKELTKKIDGVISGFATYKDIEAAKQQAKLEHDAIYEKIGDVETDVSYLKSRNWVHNNQQLLRNVKEEESASSKKRVLFPTFEIENRR